MVYESRNSAKLARSFLLVETTRYTIFHYQARIFSNAFLMSGNENL